MFFSIVTVFVAKEVKVIGQVEKKLSRMGGIFCLTNATSPVDGCGQPVDGGKPGTKTRYVMQLTPPHYINNHY